MAMRLKEIKAVTRRREDGGWVGELPDLDGIQVRVRAIFNSLWSKETAKARATVSAEEFQSEHFQDELQTHLLRETSLLDWTGVLDDEGNELPYTIENADKLLTDPDYETFRRAVIYAAQVVASQGKERLEAEIKN